MEYTAKITVKKTKFTYLYSFVTNQDLETFCKWKWDLDKVDYKII